MSVKKLKKHLTPKQRKRRQKLLRRARKHGNKFPKPEPRRERQHAKKESQSSEESNDNQENDDDSTDDDNTSDCMELKHDSVTIFGGESTIKSRAVDKMIASMKTVGVPNLVIQSITRHLKPKIADFSTNQCIWVPHSPHANILRIVAHPMGPENVNRYPTLIISSEQIEVDENQTCEQICSDKQAEECVCVAATQDVAFWDSIPSDFGGKIIYVTDHVEGGQKYLTTEGGNAGFEIIRMFTNVLNHGIPDQNRVNIMIMPSQGDGDLMYVGGRSVENILLSHLNADINEITHPVLVDTPPGPEPIRQDDGDIRLKDLVQPKPPSNRNKRRKMRQQRRKLLHKKMKPTPRHGKFGYPGEMPPIPPPSSCKVNVIMQLKSSPSDSDLLGNEQYNVLMQAIPLSSPSGMPGMDALECHIDQANMEQCSIYLGCSDDYDLRIENLGGVAVELDIFTVDVPTNGDVDMDYAADQDYYYDPMLQQSMSNSNSWSSSSSESMDHMERYVRRSYTKSVSFKQELPIIMGVVAAIMVFMSLAVFCLLHLNSQRQRKRKRNESEGIAVGEVVPDHISKLYTRFSIEESNDHDQVTPRTLQRSNQQALSYQVFAVPQTTTAVTMNTSN